MNEGVLTENTYTGQDIYTDDHPPIIMTGPIGAASGDLLPGYLLKKANNILVPIERTQAGVPLADVALTPSDVVGVCLETADGDEDASVLYLVHGTVCPTSITLAGDALIEGERELLAQVGIFLL